MSEPPVTGLECKHELLISQCDYCKPKPPKDLFGEPADVGPWFEAEFAAPCHTCESLVLPGEMIRYREGQLECEVCTDDN